MLIFRKYCCRHLSEVGSISFIYQNNTSEARKKERISLFCPPAAEDAAAGHRAMDYIAKGKTLFYSRTPYLRRRPNREGPVRLYLLRSTCQTQSYGWGESQTQTQSHGGAGMIWNVDGGLGKVGWVRAGASVGV